MEEKLQGYKDMLKDLGCSVDNELFDAIVKPLKGILGNPDACFVAATDESEMNTVKKNFVEKKLGVTGDAADAAVAAVAAQMKGINKKPRVVFYYLLCMETGKSVV